MKLYKLRDCIIQTALYSRTSHNGLSDLEIQTASIHWTNNVPPIDFAIEIIHFQPPRRTTSHLWTTDKKHAPK